MDSKKINMLYASTVNAALKYPESYMWVSAGDSGNERVVSYFLKS